MVGKHYSSDKLATKSSTKHLRLLEDLLRLCRHLSLLGSL